MTLDKGRIFVAASLLALLIPYLTTEAFAQQMAKSSELETYNDPYFGVSIDVPAEWYQEADNPWQHTHVTPWHLPLIPIKELQPTAVDILLERTKTLVVHFEPGDETSSNIRVSVEKMPFGTTLEDYAQHAIARIERNNDNVKVEETSSTTLAGNPAMRLVTTTSTVSDDFSFSAKTMQVVTLYGNLAYIVEYQGNVEYYDDHLDAAESALKSTRIAPPASYAQMLSMPLIISMAGIATLVSVKSRRKNSATRRFLRETRRMFPSAFGIEVLCVLSAEIGGLVALYVYGFNAVGIIMAYLMAYVLAGFTTFVSILGRTRTAMKSNDQAEHVDAIICGCSYLTEAHGTSRPAGYLSSLKQTFQSFVFGLSVLTRIHKMPGASRIFKASLLVLLSAESGCIIAAATVDVVLYQYSSFLSIPVALLAGTLTVAITAAYRSTKKGQLRESSQATQQ